MLVHQMVKNVLRMHILQKYAQVAHFCTPVLAAAQIVTGKRKGDARQYGQRLANSVGTATNSSP